MKLTRRILNSKFAERFRRQLALKSGMYCKIKVMAPSVSDFLRTARLLNHFGVTKVLDIGANTGQFAESLIDFGYKGKIVSFEPVQSAYEILCKRAKKYSNWEVASRRAIGNYDGEVNINVSDDTQFSSIKNIKQEFLLSTDAAKVLKQELVQISTVDSLKGQFFNENDVVFLKIDTQGFEKEVIEGAKDLIKNVKGIKIEIPLVNDLEIYENVDWDIKYYFDMFYSLGFKPVSIDALGANRETGFVNEVDCIFVRF